MRRSRAARSDSTAPYASSVLCDAACSRTKPLPCRCGLRSGRRTDKGARRGDVLECASGLCKRLAQKGRCRCARSPVAIDAGQLEVDSRLQQILLCALDLAARLMQVASRAAAIKL